MMTTISNSSFVLALSWLLLLISSPFSSWVVVVVEAKDVDFNGFFLDGAAGCSSGNSWRKTITISDFKVECDGNTNWGGGYQQEEEEDREAEEGGEEEDANQEEEEEEYESPFDLCDFGQEIRISGTSK